MDELKQAYQTLGLAEDASKEELENRYFLLMRRHKAQANRAANEPSEPLIDIDRISAAYKTIKDHLLEKAKLENPIYQAEMQKSPLRRKVDHFLFHYRVHLIVGIALVIGAYFVVASIVESRQEKAAEAQLPPPNLELMFFGDFYSDNEKAVAERLLELFPDWQRIKVIVAYSPWEARDQFDMASQQKAMVLLATERPDLYVIDEARFEIHSLQGSFQPLDELVQPLVDRGAIAEEQLVYGQSEEDPEPRIYGIALGDPPVLDDVRVNDAAPIAVLRIGSEKTVEALTFIETLANQEL